MKRATLEARLWVAQRASAALLAVFVLVHLMTLIYAVRHGLTAQAILERTRGNMLVGTFYASFVALVAIHVPLGLRAVLQEWLGWRRGLAWALAAYAALILIAGLRAVYGLVGATA